jgi:carboxyl-terminal processing protease
LNDSQTYYQIRGRTLGPAPVGGCTATSPPSVSPPPSVGYVKVASCDCEGVTATTFAESVQQIISAADRPGLAGWIVDLRGNIGGNMWPMIAGIGPVMGEGIIGWIVYNNREYEREYRNGAALSLGEAFASVDRPYRLLKEYPRVAVLTDGLVSSAAEAITVYFKGRPDTRSFGTPTCGHHHLQQSFPFNDGAVLGLAVSQHADRTKRQYAGSIEPDEIVTDPSEAASRAIAWLLSGR